MNAFLVASRVSATVPVPVTRMAASALAWTAWVTHAKAARRLEGNLHRVTGLEGRALRSLSRRGLASVARYYAEALELGRMTGEQIDARVRMEGYEAVRGLLAQDRGFVAVLSHSGNWDLIGAYAARHIIPITAVAEVLRPREVFDQFVALRERIGIRVLGHEGGSTFRSLITIARSERALVCLLSDRDLSGSGVEVEMWGRGVKVAPGPAALGIAARTQILPVMVRYERLRGARRRAAGSRWGCVLEFGPVLDPADLPDDLPREDRVAALSQQWASWLAGRIAEHPEDWHMLQRFGWTS